MHVRVRVLVRLLRADGDDATAEMRGGIASAVRGAQRRLRGDKAGGAVLNSLVFHVHHVRDVRNLPLQAQLLEIIWAYMGFGGLLIFGVLDTLIAMEVLRVIELPVDILTFAFRARFAIVGCSSPSSGWARSFEQYLVAVAVVLAFCFTHIPVWTTWTLLVAMAIYDLCAVLTPAGLRVLVELAQERDERSRAVYERGRWSDHE